MAGTRGEVRKPASDPMEQKSEEDGATGIPLRLCFLEAATLCRFGVGIPSRRGAKTESEAGALGIPSRHAQKSRACREPLGLGDPWVTQA